MSEAINDPELLAEFASESAELLEDISSQLIACERLTSTSEMKTVLDGVFRSIHSIKGNSSFFGLDFIQRLSHGTENLLDDLRQFRLSLNQSITTTLLASVDLLSRLIEAINDPKSVCDEASLQAQLSRIENLRQVPDDVQPPWQTAAMRVQSLLGELTNEQQRAINDLLAALETPPSGTAPTLSEVGQAQVDPPVNNQTDPDAETGPEADSKTAGKTESKAESRGEGRGEGRGENSERRVMRIDEERIDAFLSYVGELVVIGDMFNHILKRLHGLRIDRELTNGLAQVIGTFQHLSAQLQSAIMSVRTVPAKQLLRKAPKLVRDIAQTQGKSIRVEMSGENTEIDKGYVDLLDAPLVHMVRNAADHGIEPPDERIAQGKSAEGLICISINDDNESIVFTLQDDGRGINRDKLAAKARSLGVIAADAELDEDALIECMFAAGVSTAEAVSDISGRGVGMDVVKRAIEQAGGRIAVSSESGHGSTFTISLPKSVTTQIGMGYFVRCGTELFILDLESVEETFHHTSAPQHTPEGLALIQRRGQTLPLINISALLQITNESPPQVAITTQVHRQRCALLVDEVIGIKQMVKLPLELPGHQQLPYQGVAMQGDGHLALILDLDILISDDLRPHSEA